MNYLFLYQNVILFYSETLPLLSFFEKRTVKQTAWKSNLEIGPGFNIPVCGYLKVFAMSFTIFICYLVNSGLCLVYRMIFF